MNRFPLARALLTLSTLATSLAFTSFSADTPEIRTPKPSPSPHINGPGVFGVRPGAPFLYRIPATGDRPMEFTSPDLPAGLHLDASSGQITGSLVENAGHIITLRAKNAVGRDTRRLLVVVGETIALTPPMGWNSWNAWGSRG